MRFLVELDCLLARVEERPRQFPTVGEETRRGLLRRFPYGVYFIVEKDVVVVIALLHMSRHPDSWRDRS